MLRFTVLLVFLRGLWWVECSGFVFCFWIFRWWLGCFLVTVLTFGVINLLCAVEFSFFSLIPKTWSRLSLSYWRIFDVLSLGIIFSCFPSSWKYSRSFPIVIFIDLIPDFGLEFSLVWTRCFVDCLFFCFCFSSCNRHHCLKLSLSFSK